MSPFKIPDYFLNSLVRFYNMHIWWTLPTISSRKLDVGGITDIQISDRLSTNPITPKLDIRFLNQRLSFTGAEYLFVKIEHDGCFALVRRAKIRKFPFLALLHLNSCSAKCTKKLTKNCKVLAFRMKAIGVVGCWTEGAVEILKIHQSGMKRSRRFQRVIVRELNGFKWDFSSLDCNFSWLDSDTL